MELQKRGSCRARGLTSPDAAKREDTLRASLRPERALRDARGTQIQDPERFARVTRIERVVRFAQQASLFFERFE
jgi:hypothetical protein